MWFRTKKKGRNRLGQTYECEAKGTIEMASRKKKGLNFEYGTFYPGEETL
jgi:hypothetical protein